MRYYKFFLRLELTTSKLKIKINRKYKRFDVLMEKIRFALINPPSKETIQPTERPNVPVLSLGYLTSILKMKDVDVLSIDASYEGWSINDVILKVEAFRPSIVGLTAMTIRINQAVKIATILKKKFPEARIIIGGAHSTIAPIETLKQFPVFDIAVIGEGENTLSELIDFFKKTNIDTKDMTTIKGIAFRQGPEIIQNEPRELIQDLDTLTIPDYSFVVRPLHTYPLYTSRGCPFHCVFCCRILGNKIRVRSPFNVVNELSIALKKYPIRFVTIEDEVFTFPIQRAKDICDLMIKNQMNKKVKWLAQSRVTRVDQELFNKMKKAGCVRVEFGVESGNPEILKIIKKGITVNDALRTVRMAKNAGLKTGCFFIIGHPYENEKTIEDTLKLAVKLNPTAIAVGIMVPYPGTEVYEMALRGEGNYVLQSKNWDDYDKQIGNALSMRNLSRQKLEFLHLKVYLLFYLYNFRILDLIKLLYKWRELILKVIRKISFISFIKNFLMDFILNRNRKNLT